MSITSGCGDDILKKLIKDFYSGCLKLCLQPQDIKMMTWDKQQYFLDATVNTPRVKKYPVNSEFSRLFFKKVIELLELGQDVHDDFYTYLCSNMTEERDKGDFCFRHYVVGNDYNNNIITMKETNKIVINGTTGMRTWQAALMLSDWALCNRELFRRRRVLELGSGVGFTGIAIAKLCEINSITFSDCHSHVLRMICDNIEINFSNIRKEETLHEVKYTDEQKTLAVIALDWNWTENIPKNRIPDIIIGADIIYDPAIINPLCDTIKMFFDRNKYLEVYIASVIRNENTFNQFLKTLEAMNIIYETIPHDQSVYIEWDQNNIGSLLKLRRSNK